MRYSKYKRVDNIGTRTVDDGNTIAILHNNGDLYTHGNHHVKAEDLKWLMAKALVKAFEEGKNSGNSTFNPYKFLEENRE